MAEKNSAETHQVELQSILSLAGMAMNLIQTISHFLLMIKSRFENNMLLAAHSTERKSYWKERVSEKSRRKANRQRRSAWYVKGRTDKWWDNMISGRLPENNWKKNFRMSRQQFEKLVNELNQLIAPNLTSPNYRVISSTKKVGIALYYLKDTGSLSMTANAFNVSICTVSKIIREVCSAITYKLGPKYVKLPQTAEDMIEKASEFLSKYGMHQAFGCIDGTHVPILRPTEHSQDYFCYKQYFSLNVQAICDFKGMFMDIDCT
ncbi:uncharacterized protein LOC114527736 [Dendronephthya gigantea]|uniref:uncharacterized protein LOC114527736 n=1 Tax=Dendronephthya gigantea TaxID=151771 RepID=UPI00106D5EA6|nr:uncharacterized protein LOC114527736 [Dendronephthya gigantea]